MLSHRSFRHSFSEALFWKQCKLYHPINTRLAPCCRVTSQGQINTVAWWHASVTQTAWFSRRNSKTISMTWRIEVSTSRLGVPILLNDIGWFDTILFWPRDYLEEEKRVQRACDGHVILKLLSAMLAEEVLFESWKGHVSSDISCVFLDMTIWNWDWS